MYIRRQDLETTFKTWCLHINQIELLTLLKTALLVYVDDLGGSGFHLRPGSTVLMVVIACLLATLFVHVWNWGF